MAAKATKNNKNQTAAARAEDNRTSANAPLNKQRTCCDCGGAITKRGEFEPVKLVAAGGKARMRARHKGGCPKA